MKCPIYPSVISFFSFFLFNLFFSFFSFSFLISFLLFLLFFLFLFNFLFPFFFSFRSAYFLLPQPTNPIPIKLHNPSVSQSARKFAAKPLPSCFHSLLLSLPLKSHFLSPHQASIWKLFTENYYFLTFH